MTTFGSVGDYGDDTLYGGTPSADPIPQHTNCVCGDGWRVEATELTTGRVKAVLHPVLAEWEDPLSMIGAGSVTVATRDPRADDVWPHTTGIYISRVLPDGSRDGRFGGYVEKFSGSSGGATQVGLQSIDEYLFHRLMADDDEGLGYSTPGYVSANVPGPGKSQTEICRDLVNLAKPKGVPLFPKAFPSTRNRVRHWDPLELKNIGQAVKEMVEVIDGVKYRLVHVFEDGYWHTDIEFYDDFGADRGVILKSDREGWQYGLEVDAKDSASRAYGTGAGASEGNADDRAAKVSIAYDAAALMPEFHAALSWPDVSVQETLDSHVRGYVASYRDPISTPNIVIAGLDNPKPETLWTGDYVEAQIDYGLLTFRNRDGEEGANARVLGISWRVAVDEPVTRTVALQTVVRPSTAIRTQVPPPQPNTPLNPPQTTNPPPATPIDPGKGGTLTPYPTPGLRATVKDDRLTEISGMQYSSKQPYHVWVHNDENESPQVYLVSTADGYVKGSYTPKGPARVDPEAIRLHPDGRLVLADIGDNDGNRPNVRLYAVKEPTTNGGKGPLDSQVYTLTYPPAVGSVNAETLLIHPVTKEWVIVTKENSGRAISFGTGTAPAAVGSVKAVGLGKDISDGTFTPNGKFILFRLKDVKNTHVYDAATYKKVGEITSPTVEKGESITMDGPCSFLIGSEGADSPIYRVLLPKEFGATCGEVPKPVPSYPSGVFDLKFWKLALPTPLGSTEGVDEVQQPKLAKFKSAKYFFPAKGKNGKVGVVFRCPVDGGRTSTRTKYPRTELREMWKNGRYDESEWSMKSGSHTMTIVQAVNVFPGKTPELVCGQIHDGLDDVLMFRATLKTPNSFLLTAEFSKGHGEGTDVVPLGTIGVGAEFTVKVVASGGNMDVYLNGALKVKDRKPYSGTDNKNYFKAGCYVQANASGGGNKGTGFGEVIIYELDVVHAA